MGELLVESTFPSSSKSHEKVSAPVDVDVKLTVNGAGPEAESISKLATGVF